MNDQKRGRETINPMNVLTAVTQTTQSNDDKKPVGNDICALRKPNEAGKIMVVIFHKFVEDFQPSQTDNGAFTTTIVSFRKLLETLYDKGYRLINLNDYLKGDVSVPVGCIPIVFTYDDGAAGQFNLVEKEGKLVANPKTAVGVMEDFNQLHPDFGLKGTFYVNLGLETFKGKGSLSQRLKYLIDKGFEIGNHTLTHINLKNEQNTERIIREIGGEQKVMQQLVPGYHLNTFALPYGQFPKVLDRAIVKGKYKGVKYENFAIMKVAWDPMDSPWDVSFDPFSFRRVLSACMNPAVGDLDWWIKNLPLKEQYVSDGSAEVVTVPLVDLCKVDLKKLKEKRLILN